MGVRMVNLITANTLFYFALEFQTDFKTKVKMETQTITFDQLPHVVSGLSEKLDQVLDILEKLGIANSIKNVKPSRRLVYAKEACQIIGKSHSSLYRGIKAPNDPIPSYKRGKLLYFYEDELYAWIENGRKHSVAPSLAETAAAITAGMKRCPHGGYKHFLSPGPSRSVP